MKAAVFRRIGLVEVAEVPEPTPGPHEVVIRVGYCGLCGSDVEALHTGFYAPDVIMGHEFSGTIAQVGPEVKRWHEGDRVVINDAIPCTDCVPCREGRLDNCDSLTMVGVTHDGGLAEYVEVPARGLHSLAEGLTLRHAALVEPLAVALQGVRRSRLEVGDCALVMGAGPIGLLTLQCALLGGARAVVVTEVNPTRRELAAELGAAAVLDPTRDNVGAALSNVMGPQSPDVVYICTGEPEPFGDAMSLVRGGGQIMVLGLCVEPVEFDFLSAVLRELSLEGSLAGRAEFPAAIDFVAQGRVDVEALISHEITLDQVVTEGFDRLSAVDSEAVKILVRIGGEV